VNELQQVSATRAPREKAMQALRLIQIALLHLGLVVSLPLLADDSDQLPLLQAREKSTLETFPLQSLEADDLSNAVIGGTLDVPAAGAEEVDLSVIDLLPKEMDTPQDLSDLGRHNVPTTIHVRTQPVALEGRTYSWDFNTTQR